MPPLVVPIESLRRAIGLDAADATQDDALLDLEKRAVAFAEEQFERRFQAGLAHVEYRWGNNSRSLYIRGHVEDTEAPDAVTIRERAPGGDWEAFTAFDVRANGQLVRNDGLVWYRSMEYEITYSNGYEEAPGDIISFILDLVGTAWISLTSAGTEDLSSEKIGDYSYTVSSSTTTGSNASGILSSLSDDSIQTYHRWRRRHI